MLGEFSPEGKSQQGCLEGTSGSGRHCDKVSLASVQRGVKRSQSEVLRKRVNGGHTTVQPGGRTAWPLFGDTMSPAKRRGGSGPKQWGLESEGVGPEWFVPGDKEAGT